MDFLPLLRIDKMDIRQEKANQQKNTVMRDALSSDHLVRPCEHVWRLLSRIQIDGELKFRRLLDW
jgi:hypothetical protein